MLFILYYLCDFFKIRWSGLFKMFIFYIKFWSNQITTSDHQKYHIFFTNSFTDMHTWGNWFYIGILILNLWQNGDFSLYFMPKLNVNPNFFSLLVQLYFSLYDGFNILFMRIS